MQGIVLFLFQIFSLKNIMIKIRTIGLIFIVLAGACDKQDTSIESPETHIAVNLSGAITDNWENDDGWFVINQLYYLNNQKQLSITLSKDYTNISIVFSAMEEKLQKGTYPLVSKLTESGGAQAEYYILGSKEIYKSLSGALTISELSTNKVKGFINGTFSNPLYKENLFVEGSFTIPPLY